MKFINKWNALTEFPLSFGFEVLNKCIGMVDWGIINCTDFFKIGREWEYCKYLEVGNKKVSFNNFEGSYLFRWDFYVSNSTDWYQRNSRKLTSLSCWKWN